MKRHVSTTGLSQVNTHGLLHVCMQLVNTTGLCHVNTICLCHINTTGLCHVNESALCHVCMQHINTTGWCHVSATGLRSVYTIIFITLSCCKVAIIVKCGSGLFTQVLAVIGQDHGVLPLLFRIRHTKYGHWKLFSTQAVAIFAHTIPFHSWLPTSIFDFRGTRKM